MGYRIFVFLVTQYDVENGHQSSANKGVKIFLSQINQASFVQSIFGRRLLCHCKRHKTAVLRIVDMTPQDLKIIKIPDDTEVCHTSSMTFELEIKKEFKSPTTSLSIGSILDSPRKVILKRELHKCRKRLISKEKVIDNLRKKNSRLVKKTISLKNAPKVLKKRFKLDSNLRQYLTT